MTTLLQTDAVHLARAIELAEGGRGRTTPNPLVGAVVVKDGEVIGVGQRRGGHSTGNDIKARWPGWAGPSFSGRRR